MGGTVTAKLALRLLGGGSLPIKQGQLHLTWPFVILESDGESVTVTVQPRPIRSLLSALGGVDGAAADGTERWSYRWCDVGHVFVAPRKIVIIPKSGRGCRFVVVRKSTLITLVTSMRELGLDLEPIGRFSRKGLSL
jgi:hypothetical protein